MKCVKDIVTHDSYNPGDKIWPSIQKHISLQINNHIWGILWPISHKRLTSVIDDVRFAIQHEVFEELKEKIKHEKQM